MVSTHMKKIKDSILCVTDVCLRDVKEEISSCTPVSLFRPGEVHSGSLCLDSIVSPLWPRGIKGVFVLSCKLLPALLAEWPGSLTSHYGNKGVERKPNKNQHRKLTLEKKILLPLFPGFELKIVRSRVRCCQLSYYDPLSLSLSSRLLRLLFIIMMIITCEKKISMTIFFYYFCLTDYGQKESVFERTSSHEKLTVSFSEYLLPCGKDAVRVQSAHSDVLNKLDAAIK